MTHARKYTVLSLFSGAGGLDVGLEQTGRFRTLACLEREPVFCATLSTNVAAGQLGLKPHTQVLCADVAEIDPERLMTELGLEAGELDVLVGGPPCQTFSTAGRRGTVQDPRGTLLWQFSRFVSVFRPRAFLMENVRGLLSAATRHRPIRQRPEHGGAALDLDESPGSVVEQWYVDLCAATGGEYRVDCFEVNAVNYGAPQLRERALFFGNRSGAVIDFPLPTHGEGLLPFAVLGEALDTVDRSVPDEVLDFSPRKKAYLDMVPEGGNWRALPEQIQQESMGRAWYAKGGRSGWWRRLTRDLPCPTVVTMPNHASTSMCHPTETRALSLRECAAIQGFPSAWSFAGTTAQKYTQVGNAIPVRLGEVAGAVLVAHLDAVVTGQAPNVQAAPAFRRVYLDSHVRTRQWYKRGVTFVWVSGRDNDNIRYRSKRARQLALFDAAQSAEYVEIARQRLENARGCPLDAGPS